MKKKIGFCVSCQTTVSNRWVTMKDGWEPFNQFEAPEKCKKNCFCSLCAKAIWVGIANEEPIIKPTPGKLLGNGLFVERDSKERGNSCLLWW